MRAEQGSQSSFVVVDKDNGLEELQRRIQELQRERDALKSDLNAKTGEIAIVRSKQETEAKKYERELVAVRKLNEDKLAKAQKELEASRISEKNIAIERDFIRQDLTEESERVRRLNKAKAVEKTGGPAVTPKKKKTLPHRDGFDDDEIEVLSPSRVSPSKFQRRLAGSPSRLGAKRKRKAVESPISALDVQQEVDVSASLPVAELILDDAIIESLGRQDDRLDFLGTMLDHRIDRSHRRTIQELEKYSLPSKRDESFQSMILGKIPILGFKKAQKDLPIDFCELLISLWSKCMEEKYYKPIHLLLDMLTLAVELKTTLIAPLITDSLVPLAQQTADLLVIPRFRGQLTEIEKYQSDINVTACLAVLHIVALGCMSDQEFMMRFWKLMRYDFVVSVLSPNHPVKDFEMMIRLLSTSVFKDSVGAIIGDGTDPNQILDAVLDRLTHHLVEVPLLPNSKDHMDLAILSKLRVKILQLLTSMTRSPIGSRAMAMHGLTIGRLVSLISDELDNLYDYRARHEESARIISLGMRLVYHIVTKYDNEIDIQKKLLVIRGGSQKYLLCLSRLNFSEDDLVLESGIDSDVAGCALELLELVVTPEEGDAIHSAFSSQ
ncbi:DNA repair protein-like protein Rad26 [Halenospora varia]|nr:DNA repair protein-like protein Rad26 [Halenospora varia]